MPLADLWQIIERLLYEYHINIELNYFIVKFADDTKILNLITADLNRLSLQEGMKKISEWYDKWDMPF